MSKSILLIITGSIAAYKALDVIRRLREHNVRVTCILTKGGAEFVTPLSVAALSGEAVYSDLFSLKDEHEMGHIRLSREHDLVAVLPASADIIAKMANGLADDLATTTLLATDKPVVIAPAMNSRMWEHPATKRNLTQLRKDGISIIEPASGNLACGEVGEGRLADPEVIAQRLITLLEGKKPLQGLRAFVTSGPTYEPIDPVRFIGNRSSGKQGNAIAKALHEAGATVTLISGPASEHLPKEFDVVRVQTAQEMLDACKAALPSDIAVFCAAVADWHVAKPFEQKLKKRANGTAPAIELALNPDLLQHFSTLKRQRPKLVVGFAAETEALEKHAREKLKRKGCDWIIANDVSEGKVFGCEETSALFLNAKQKEIWDAVSKQELARRLVQKITQHFGERKA
ncbi:MAG TPA: bifunctional phosphopantothenoylcysteine decarboxylase/phosphopantothenate--cysteine ligase CoaBC [Rickettsiales bacterium]|nr:bifunctional phosphopantothenoylcysteine decarboxylase/phosphopantothenate--cysteine ligase CoaBC [Rickettsiales bacterium]